MNSEITIVQTYESILKKNCIISIFNSQKIGNVSNTLLLIITELCTKHW